MIVNRRQFLQATLAGIGLAAIPPEVSTNPLPFNASTMPLQFTTRKGESDCMGYMILHAATLPPGALEIKKNGMQFLINHSQLTTQLTNKKWLIVHIRNTEVVHRVIEKRNLAEPLKDLFPYTTWSYANTKIYWALYHELQKIKPDENNFTEEYAQQLTKYLMKVPLSRIRADINKQIAKEIEESFRIPNTASL